jgi:hypothetical protein
MLWSLMYFCLKIGDKNLRYWLKLLQGIWSEKMIIQSDVFFSKNANSFAENMYMYVKIAENRDHNIDPQHTLMYSVFTQKTDNFFPTRKNYSCLIFLHVTHTWAKTASRQGCQIFLAATYQNGENIPNYHKMYQMATKYTKWPQCTKNIPKTSISRPPKIYPNFWFENMQSGSPASRLSPTFKATSTKIGLVEKAGQLENCFGHKK